MRITAKVPCCCWATCFEPGPSQRGVGATSSVEQGSKAENWHNEGWFLCGLIHTHYSLAFYSICTTGSPVVMVVLRRSFSQPLLRPMDPSTLFTMKQSAVSKDKTRNAINAAEYALLFSSFDVRMEIKKRTLQYTRDAVPHQPQSKISVGSTSGQANNKAHPKSHKVSKVYHIIGYYLFTAPQLRSCTIPWYIF